VVATGIKGLREVAGVTQEQLAFTAGVARFRLGAHERGVLVLREEEMTALLAALKKLLWERQINFVTQMQAME
jgi:DNA-binding XRE family transcriptional regulator